MDQVMRFEISLPLSRRQELDALATELGVSASDLARFAISRLLANSDVLTGRSDSARDQ